MPQQNPLTTEPIPKLVRRIAVPACVGYFFNTMYNVVDTYFAGLISTQALASLSLSLPVYFIIIATGTGVSTGATALIANAMGAGKREEAKLYAAQAVSFGILSALALTLFGLLVSPFLFRLLGATGEYLSMVLDYMNTLFLGTVFFMVLYMLNAVLNGQGETRPFRNFLIVGFFLNIALWSYVDSLRCFQTLFLTFYLLLLGVSRWFFLILSLFFICFFLKPYTTISVVRLYFSFLYFLFFHLSLFCVPSFSVCVRRQQEELAPSSALNEPSCHVYTQDFLCRILCSSVLPCSQSSLQAHLAVTSERRVIVHHMHVE